MIAAVTDHITEIEALCRRFGVRRLVVFGSAVDGTFRAGLSDVDFLVELDPPDPTATIESGDWVNEIHPSPGGYKKSGRVFGPFIESVLAAYP